LYGNSIGKKLLKCKIITLKGGVEISRKIAMMRILAYIPSLAFLGIGVIFMIFSKKKQALHDMMVGTIVINNRVEKE
jgi:uncharacterized RDD family membrane protein YckC